MAPVYVDQLGVVTWPYIDVGEDLAVLLDDDDD